MDAPNGSNARGALARLSLAGATAATACAAVTVLTGLLEVAGAATAGAGALLAAARRLAGARGFDPIMASFVDRAFDGAVLGAIAWALRAEDPAGAVGALFALSASSIAAYVRARGAALGYGVEEGTALVVLRYTLVAGGLAFGPIGAAVWTVAALSGLALLVRSSQVLKEERA